MSMLTEFKEFAVKGNVVDMAVGVIIGTAFGKIVSSVVSDVITPPIGLVVGKVDFTNMFVDLSRTHPASLAAAKAAGANVLSYGMFLQALFDFLVIALVLFVVVKQLNKLKSAPAAATKECPFCISTIPAKATRCAHCTAELKLA
jgi:large conductance mechanosensitive channel